MKRFFGWCLIIWGILMFLGFVGHEQNGNSIISLFILSIVPFFFGIRLILKVHKESKLPQSRIIKERKESEISEIQQIELTNLLKQRIEEIKIANSQFSNFLNYEFGYFSNYTYRSWKEKYEIVYSQIKDIPYKHLKLDSETEQLVTVFFHYIRDGLSLKDTYNQEFIEVELKKYQEFFDYVEGRKLDEQQRKAIIIDEDNNIVIAGAGSGKTTTIAGKVSYILERYKVHPKDILLISFTCKACEEMKRRIKAKMGIAIDVMTFHKLGKEIIADVSQIDNPIFLMRAD